MDSIYTLAVIFSAVDKMTGPAKKVFGNLKNYENVIEKGKGMYEYGKQLGISSALAQNAADKMTGALQSLMGPTIEIGDSLANLKTVTTSTMGGLDKSMAASRSAAIKWSRQHANSAAEFLNASTIIAGAGLNDIQAIEGTKVALTVAKATFGEAGETAELLGVMYNNMADKTKNVRSEMQKLGDVVTVTQQRFQIKNMSQLAEGLRYAIPSAKKFQTSIQEVSTVIGELNTVGLAGSQAGTAYSAAMRQMLKASQELGFAIAKNSDGGVSFIGTIENIRRKYGDFNKMSDATKMAFQQAFGDEGERAISLLLGKTGDLNEALKAVTDSAGAAAAAQKIIEKESASNQFKIFRQNIDSLKDALAIRLLPTITALLPHVIKIVDAFGRFAEKHPGLVKIMVTAFALGAGVLAIVAPIMSVVSGFMMMGGVGLQGIGKIVKGILWLKTVLTGSVIPAVWSFTAALLANPITWIVLGIVALIAAGYLLVKNWDKVKVFFIGLWNGIVNIWNKAFNWVKQNIAIILAVFMPFVGIPLLIIQNWNKIGPMLGQVFGYIRNLFSNLGKMAFEWGGNLLNNFINGIKEKIGSLQKGLTYTAEQIKKFLGFHSPAEAGPGASAGEWAPNLMKMYQAGIIAGTPGVKKAALTAAMGISMALSQAAPAMAYDANLTYQSAPVTASAFRQNESAPANAPQYIFQNCTFEIKTDSAGDLLTQLKNLAEESEHEI